MTKYIKGMSKPLLLYFLILAFSGIGLGLSDGVFANFFKDAYNITAFQRGLIEFPRELPGLLCAVVISSLSFLGDIKTAIIAQSLSVIGLAVLGLTTPSFTVMLIFLFINSLGMHMYMPLNDSIGMNIAEKDKVGIRMGQYNGFKTIFSLLTGGVVFLGFKTGFFSFKPPIKAIFMIGVGAFIVCLVLFVKLNGQIKDSYPTSGKTKIFMKKKYLFYYILATLHGAQKQIMYVYAPWVIIELLGKQADTMALLGIVGSIIGIFFMPLVGRWIDRFGVKRLMFADALSFIFVYLAYGVLSSLFVESAAIPALLVGITYGLFVADRLSMQFGMVKVVYLKKIADCVEDITPTLSVGISLDHIVSITCAYIGGIVWTTFGPQYVFFGAAGLSLINLVVAILVKDDENTMGTGRKLPESVKDEIKV